MYMRELATGLYAVSQCINTLHFIGQRYGLRSRVDCQKKKRLCVCSTAPSPQASAELPTGYQLAHESKIGPPLLIPYRWFSINPLRINYRVWSSLIPNLPMRVHTSCLALRREVFHYYENPYTNI
jgi:hypothetical protein